MWLFWFWATCPSRLSRLEDVPVFLYPGNGGLPHQQAQKHQEQHPQQEERHSDRAKPDQRVERKPPGAGNRKGEGEHKQDQVIFIAALAVPEAVLHMYAQESDQHHCGNQQRGQRREQSQRHQQAAQRLAQCRSESPPLRRTQPERFKEFGSSLQSLPAEKTEELLCSMSEKDKSKRQM